MEAGPFKGYVDTVIVRQGRMIASLTYFVFHEGDEQLFLGAASTVAARMKAAEATLPD